MVMGGGMEEQKYLFERWYGNPLEKLRELPNGNGGFIALATSCTLYERYAKAIIRKNGLKADKAHFIAQLMADFAVDRQTARAFWEIIRDALLHQAMPKPSAGKGKRIEWGFHSNYSEPMQLKHYRDFDFLQVNPWLFMDRVLSLCRDHLALLQESEAFPWAGIGRVTG
jgi:hypothetical protein